MRPWKSILAVLCGILAGAVVLQGFFSIWRPSSFGRFAEFPVILIYAAIIVAVVFSALVMPASFCLRRSGRAVSWLVGGVVGMLLGCLIGSLLFHYPEDPNLSHAYICASSVSGAVTVGLYAKLYFKHVA